MNECMTVFCVSSSMRRQRYENCASSRFLHRLNGRIFNGIMTGISREIQESVRFKPLANRGPWQHNPWADRAHVSFPAGPAPRLIIRTEMIRLSWWGKAVVPGASRGKQLQRCGSKQDGTVPFGTTCHCYIWKVALQDRLQWAARRVFHFGSTSQRLALTKAYVDGVFTALNRHSGLLVVVLCLTDNLQVTQQSRPIDLFDLLAMKYQAFDRGPLRRYHREL